MTTSLNQPFSPKAYWEERLTQKWGLHGVGHISYGKPYNQWLYRARKRVFLEQIRQLPLPLPNASVLDVGSGTGFWLKAWQSLGVSRLVGSDLTQVAAGRLRQEHPGTQILQLDISDNAAVGKIGAQFDAISAFDVLFHIVDDARFQSALRNIAGLLRAGGFFLFTDNLIHARSYRARHEVDRTLEDYTRLLAENRLRILRRVPVFVLMNTPYDLPFEFPRKLWAMAMYPVHLLPALGHLAGASLYSVDLLLRRLLTESPATEMVICQKVEP